MSAIVYLKVTGEQQGAISDSCGTAASVGNRRQSGHENEIFAFSLANSITSTGNGSQRHGLSFCKLIDKSTPLFSNAINNNEQLYMEFSFYRINRFGRWEKYYYIQLQGAFTSKIQNVFLTDNLDTETIVVNYEYILCKHLIANTEFSYLALPANYNRLFTPVPKANVSNGLHTLNSKSVGRLLAAGGVYNGNIAGFEETAKKLGGEAPEGYNQVMDNQGVLIAGASLITGMTMGRMKFPQPENLEVYGAKGTFTSRPFDAEKAGGPVEYLTTEGVEITHEGIDIVEKHVSRFDADPGNDFMVNRLRKIADGEISAEQVDLNYYTHECREFQRYCNLGWETGRPDDYDESYSLWNNAHTATLEDYRITGDDLYHKDAPTW
ncbi:type VI secretion system tube protein TssD [Citrobacter sp. RHB25-C09]|uniref:type VI secretion system tube protein TssD n=1 Tax=Citrobacter sp. RHB25-C09 TaxID=2742624 RepID=UPI0015EE9995|nr:type VI secretion system tube protein TssD [Citrobacter sp. RHB25-C09]QMI03537.1 type VI secretion system tube protein Hcp [Citrobacter sp. RHB25-C09]